ncbi:MAG: NAD-dependent epimerase/dehydratase family protein [Acidobacteria bacterium]|nr:NAD-dependent epimerase/dehydratase family protein [Acidobacteriota bacterium]
MRKPVTLITGAAGEIGHTLVKRLAEEGSASVITLDLKPLEPAIARYVSHSISGSILDRNLLETILAEYAVDTIYHLAALLSTRAEFTPVAAHQVNVEGTLNLLEFAQAEGRGQGAPVVFLYPSSIAVYGMGTLATKASAGRVPEDEHLNPITMYGCNKLYCEHLGRYHSRHYKQLDVDASEPRVDFRCIRFPGLISAFTVPTGGTSDFAPEMIHQAAKGEPYACFVREDTRIPFMAMPDAVDATLALARADRSRLTRTVYNIGAFNPSAGEIRDLVQRAFPRAEISFAPHPKRQAIVDSWPADVDDSAARRDWGHGPLYGLERAFDEYLIPNIRGLY